MIDIEHLDMDTTDNEYDTMTRLYGYGESCVLCGKPAMENTWYCEDCAAKWLDEKYCEWKESRDLE